MAGFTRVNGDFNPVAVYDASTGNAYTNSGNINAVTSVATVQPQGPQLQFFTLAANAGTLVTYTTNVFAAIEQLSTVMIYEANTAATDNTIALAIYPAAAYTTTTLDAAVTAALDASGASNNAVTVTATATFTN